MQAGTTQKAVFLDERGFQAPLAGRDGGGVSARAAANDGDVINGFRQSDAPQYEEMTKGKRLILEQGGGWSQTRSIQKDWWKFPAKLVVLLASNGSFDYAAGSLSRTCCFAQDDRLSEVHDFQLPSLLARFQEISSPIVELVLETGCLLAS